MKNTGLIDKKAWVESFLIQGPRPLSSYSYVSIFAWSDFFEFEFKTINDRLCVFATADGACFLYLPPLGKNLDYSTIELAFKHMLKDKPPKAVNRIENIPGNLLSAFPPGRYNQYTKSPEYVYRKEDLISLKGNAYKSQRHDCNAFVAHALDHSFEAYTDADFDACVLLYVRWADHRAKTNSDHVYQWMLKENAQVHARLLKHWQVLGLIVRVLRCEGKVIGYSFGYALDEVTFCVYAEIADLRFTGAAAYMFKSFCADEELKGFSRINTMDDFAMPNVARAKRAYHPSEMIASYTVSLL